MNTRLVAQDHTRRVHIVGPSSFGAYYFVEETEQEGDEYTGRYFAPTHRSGLYESDAEAERDARITLPWLRDKNSN